MDQDSEVDLTASVWLPVIMDDKKQINFDSNVKEIDLAAISEKDVYVRKANIV